MRRTLRFFTAALLVGCIPFTCLGADDEKAAATPAANTDADASDQATAMHGTPKIDGDIDDVWKSAASIHVKKPIDGLLTIDKDKMSTAKVKLLWDAGHLYALWEVTD